MNDGGSDHIARSLAHRANRRRVLRTATAVAFGAGLTRSRSFAKPPTVEPTATSDPLALDYPLLSDAERAILMTLFGPFPRDWNVERPERVVQTTSGIQFFDLQT